MPNNCNSYLAATVLSDGRIVTYRLLSRAQKMHVNTAKEILHEFHQQQNSKKPGSVHATYLISGIRHLAVAPEENNDPMEVDGLPSSSFPVSSLPSQESGDDERIVSSIVLVKEEDLERMNAGIQSTFKKIHSIHIYSLAPQPIKDLQVLSSVNQDIHREYAKEDPLDVAKQYGTIVNPHTKRRTGRGQPSQVLPPTASRPSSGVGSKNTPASETPDSTTSETVKPKEELAVKTEASKSQKPDPAAGKSSSIKPSLKREGSSIFKAFAKSKGKTSQLSTENSVATSVEPSAAEDESMKDASEDEQEEDLVLPSSRRSQSDREAARKVKAEREEKLREMMDVDDKEPKEPPETIEPQEEPPDDAERPGTSNSNDSATIKKRSPPPIATDEPKKRRRGHRKIVKKVTAKDEEGYLVTKEEPVWESFSEEEPTAALKSKASSTLPTVAPSSSGGAKAKKGARGKGSIASFFAKK
ncbi:MAG: hypothetical protein M1815_001039 [Lichina confinis]|nr:MAG: hypothetical protein M1815_001039 [Lichina confinis]